MAGLRDDGTEFPAELTLSMWRARGELHFAGIIRDVSARKRVEARLKQLALNDVVTGLPNRVLLFDRLDRAVTRSKRESNLLALLYIDLDGFKSVNDTLGHAAGDHILRQTASRLVRCLRKSDTVARVGGDEFTVLLPKIARAKDAATVALKILRSMRLPFRIDAATCNLNVSIGITLCPNDGSTAERLLKNADSAMYQAKERGKPNFQFFNGAADPSQVT